MKTIKKIFIILINIMFLYSCQKYNVFKFKKEYKKLVIKSINLDNIQDGEYIGECDLNLISAKVKVIVKESKIKEIIILNHKHGKGYGGHDIIKEVKKKQTLNVDVISGATYSCNIILKAIENALNINK